MILPEIHTFKKCKFDRIRIEYLYVKIISRNTPQNTDEFWETSTYQLSYGRRKESYRNLYVLEFLLKFYIKEITRSSIDSILNRNKDETVVLNPNSSEANNLQLSNCPFIQSEMGNFMFQELKEAVQRALQTDATTQDKSKDEKNPPGITSDIFQLWLAASPANNDQQLQNVRPDRDIKSLGVSV